MLRNCYGKASSLRSCSEEDKSLNIVCLFLALIFSMSQTHYLLSKEVQHLSSLWRNAWWIQQGRFCFVPIFAGCACWAQSSPSPWALQVGGHSFAKYSCMNFAPNVSALQQPAWELIPEEKLSAWSLCGVTFTLKWNVIRDCGLTHNIYAIFCFALGEYCCNFG